MKETERERQRERGEIGAIERARENEREKPARSS